MAVDDCPACHAQIVTGKVDLFGVWTGWRIAGPFLISPDGDRIGPEQLAAVLFFRRVHERYGKQRLQGNIIAADFAQQVRELVK